MGVLAYAFTANQVLTPNRPVDEHRFQVKYGSDSKRLHELWQDPFGLYTTILVGINVERGFFVGADPVLNSPTRFFISKEFKEQHAKQIENAGWHAWERERVSSEHPIEVLVGGRRENMLRYILFERDVRGEEQGPRQLVAESYGRLTQAKLRLRSQFEPLLVENLESSERHRLETEFKLSARELLELVATAPRLKMAVRGWVAEQHLRTTLEALPAVRSVQPIPGDGHADLQVTLRRSKRAVTIECKNVLRDRDAHGNARLDFMRTRVSQNDRCTRYYSATDFDVVAACMHANTERWEFRARLTQDMEPHKVCAGKLANRVVVDSGWSSDLNAVLERAAM